MSKTHLFGEMDLNLKLSSNKLYKEAFRISEACGYMPNWNKETNCLEIYSNNCEIAKIYFDKKTDKVTKVQRSQDDGKNWEILNFKDDLFEVSQSTLKRYKKEISFQTLTKNLKLPMSQGLLIQELIKRYKIPVKKVGYHFDHIGIETNKQFLLWRDNGIGAEFMGMINKEK